MGKTQLRTLNTRTQYPMHSARSRQLKTPREPAWTTTSSTSSQKGWLRRRCKSQPYVRLQMNIQWEDYDHFGFPLKVPQALSFISAMADTGCQSCLAGLKLVTKLGVSVRELIPVNIKMQTANNHNICTLGTTVLSLPGKNNEGEEQSTRQIMVTDNTDKLFLCRDACIDFNHPKHIPHNRRSQRNRICQPHRHHRCPPATTGMPVPKTDKATPNSHLPTIPSHRSQQGETPAIPPGLLRLQHVQHL